MGNNNHHLEMEPASSQRSVAIPQSRPLQIVTNFFRLNRTPAGNVALYFIKFEPNVEADNRRLIGILIESAKSSITAQIGEFMKLGNNIAAWTHKDEPFIVKAKDNKNTEFELKIRNVGYIDDSNPEAYRMYCNVVLKKMLRNLNLLQVTRLPKYYDTNLIKQIPGLGLEVWQGYTASFAHHYDRMLLNIDFASKIIRNMTALGLIQEIKANSGPNWKQAIEDQLYGLIVMAGYGNYRCYRIEGIDFESSPTSTFLRNKVEVSYQNYYFEQYEVTIRDLRQPLLISTINRGQNEIKLVPELCNLTGISEDMRKDYRAMNDIAQHTRLEPYNRLDRSQELAVRLESEETRELSDKFSLASTSEPIVVSGMRLPMEQIRIGNNEIITLDDRGGFNLRGTIFYPINIDTWAVLSTQRDQEDRDRLVKNLQNKARQIGIVLGTPYQFNFDSKNLAPYVAALNRPPKNLPVPQIGVILLPPNMKNLYQDIKLASCRQSGIPTQVILGSNVRNPKRFESIMSKLILQIATKTGSYLWALTPVENLLPKTMVVGIDVFHDVVKKAKSVVGFVASIHPVFTQYFNTVKIQSIDGEEIATALGSCLEAALIAFYENTKKRFMPDHIVVYRDGVADSQIGAIRTFEIDGMKEAISRFDNYNPNFTYIIINKKTSAKLYVNSQRGIGNPLPGTVVNSVIVPDPNSFYLISHAVTQGMASPTLYRVIENTCPIKETDVITYAKLAFKLCYMYYNWSGGIKVPAPTMMAHKLAYIVGQCIHEEEYLPNLKQLPWFY
ncbi:unnamed protein product [Blepharisma stoltei]|uniref:Uncharacterized protein n=1 Tax=Blepharisma stoltei TaxID=1481888 RepID=A0AAU9JA89_9CILI|nr:unnamed protein product [Blepharisma stoltei]